MASVSTRIFISYSHADEGDVNKLQRDLSREGAIIWIDHERLAPGTVDWEAAVREGIHQANVVIYVASPDARKSTFVRDEINLARSQGRDVIPIWVSGEVWPDCAPLGWGMSQFIDCRGSRYASGFTLLCSHLGLVATASTAEEQIAAAELRDFRLADWFHNTLDFFDDRLSQTFPGVKGLRIYTDEEAYSRLVRLLHEPLEISHDGHKSAPLWWWHGVSDLELNRFRVLDKQHKRCLLGNDELLIRAVAVYRSVRPYRSFVYVSSHADEQTGVYGYSREEIDEQLRTQDSVVEEVGYWNGQYISRSQYDDGYAEIAGEIVNTAGAEIRRRYLTPYNLFITSQMSVFNSLETDRIMAKLCKPLLADDARLSDIVHLVETLDLSPTMRGLYEIDL